MAGLENPGTRGVNRPHADDHGVISAGCAPSRNGGRPTGSRPLRETGDSAAIPPAVLIRRPKAFGRDELDAMPRTPQGARLAGQPGGQDEPTRRGPRLAWFADPAPVVASAGWALTTERVAKNPEGLDPPGAARHHRGGMRDAPDRPRWATNHCLALIGIEHPAHRARAIDIVGRLEVFKDYPTPRTARPRSRPSGSPGWCRQRG